MRMDSWVAFYNLPEKIQATINSRPRSQYKEMSGSLKFWIFVLENSNLMTNEIKTELAAFILSGKD